LRVATWNLERCNPKSKARRQRLVEYINRIDADVWIFTETYESFSPGAEFNLISFSNAAPDRHSRLGECWVAIWSRLSAHPISLSADLERVAAIRIGDLSIVGTVLPWLGDKRNGVAGSNAFCKQLELQAADWIRLNQESRGLCVAGDFNQDLSNHGHYYGSKVGRAALRFALEQSNLKCLTSGDNDPLTPCGRASIDHICVQGIAANWTPTCDVWPKPGALHANLSDHYGVYADLVL
jgi:hypothetical protein